MKKIIIFKFCLLFTSLSLAQSNKWNLEQCVRHALENNITILQAKNTLLSSEQDIISAKGNFLPAISSNISGGASLGNIEVFPGEFRDREFYSTSLGIGFSQNIFNGFRNINLLSQSKLSLERNQYELERLKDDISLNVANSYLNALFNKENLELAILQLEFSKFQLEQVKTLVDLGSEPSSTLLESQATYSRDIQNLTIAENNHDLALLSLAQLLQLPYENFDIEVIEIDTPSANLMYQDITPILNYAMQNRNEIKVAERDIELARLGTKISKSAYLPNVSLGYGFNASANFSNLTQDDQFLDQLNDNKGHSINMNVSIPIFNRNQTKAEINKSKIREVSSNLALDQAKINLESTIQRAFTDAKAALKVFEAAQLSLKSQEIAFENSQERFSLGALNSFDLEQSRIRLLNALSSSINAKYDFIFKTKVLDYYLGKR
tara:strand:- start:506 stop:1816 length:1311 start_codon:yes stop_codon:yes gene_type:complete